MLPQAFSKADLVTFSYSLSMIPNFFAAIDQALSLLHEDGILGACDFYVSAKFDPILKVPIYVEFGV